MIEEADVQRFMALFKGNERSFGSYNPRAATKMYTVKNGYTDEHIRSHLEGEIGIGMVPILDNDTCWWAALDIDVHGPNAAQVDLIQIEQRITRAELPLITCRSKSGGAHCYLFLSEPHDVGAVRAQLARWAGIIGHPSAEVFPKQVTLKPPAGDKERPLGNWINLPYYASDETERYAVDGGKQVSLEYFLELAEGRRVDLAEFQQVSTDDYVVGPPCLQKMIEMKVEEGGRNTAMFQAAVFLKRAYPEDWRKRMEDFNRSAFATAMQPRELRTIRNSVAKKDYQYKCREEPCRSLCNKDLCRTREHGITDNDMIANEIPLIDAVEKVVATPIRWVLTIKDKQIEVTTGELFNYDAVRQKVGEKLHIILPRIKNQEWDQYLREIMSKVKVRKETTIEDLIFSKLCEFLRRARVEKNRPENDRRDDLKRGQPTLISISNTWFKDGKAVPEGTGEKVWYYAFRATDFIEFLRKKKSLPVPDHQVPTYLYRVLGEEAKRDKIRVGDARIGNVWCVPEKNVDEEDVPVKVFTSEF